MYDIILPQSDCLVGIYTIYDFNLVAASEDTWKHKFKNNLGKKY